MIDPHQEGCKLAISSCQQPARVLHFILGCGACKSAKHGFYKAAVEASDELEDEVGFAIFNAFAYRSDIADYDIRVSVSQTFQITLKLLHSFL